jgi:hypothetical protein
VPDSLFRHVRLKGGGFRNGRRWKLWVQVGDWCAFDAGLGGFWLWIGRLSVSANRRVTRKTAPDKAPDVRAVLNIEWRRS